MVFASSYMPADYCIIFRDICVNNDPKIGVAHDFFQQVE